jgi:hypothetical protein
LPLDLLILCLLETVCLTGRLRKRKKEWKRQAVFSQAFCVSVCSIVAVAILSRRDCKARQVGGNGCAASKGSEIEISSSCECRVMHAAGRRPTGFMNFIDETSRVRRQQRRKARSVFSSAQLDDVTRASVQAPVAHSMPPLPDDHGFSPRDYFPSVVTVFSQRL